MGTEEVRSREKVTPSCSLSGQFALVNINVTPALFAVGRVGRILSAEWIDGKIVCTTEPRTDVCFLTACFRAVVRSEQKTTAFSGASVFSYKRARILLELMWGQPSVPGNESSTVAMNEVS